MKRCGEEGRGRAEVANKDREDSEADDEESTDIQISHDD